MLADLNSSRTNKVGETVARTVIGRQAPTKSRLFTGNSQFSVDCRSAPHRFYHGPLRSSPAVDDTYAGTRVKESGAQRGCLDLWGIPLRHIVLYWQFFCSFALLSSYDCLLDACYTIAITRTYVRDHTVNDPQKAIRGLDPPARRPYTSYVDRLINRPPIQPSYGSSHTARITISGQTKGCAPPRVYLVEDLELFHWHQLELPLSTQMQAGAGLNTNKTLIFFFLLSLSAPDLKSFAGARAFTPILSHRGRAYPFTSCRS